MMHTDGAGKVWKVRYRTVALWWLSSRLLDAAEWLNRAGNKTDVPR